MMAAAVDSPKREMTATFFTVFLTFYFMNSCSGRHASAMEQCGVARIRPPLTATTRQSYGARTDARRAGTVAGRDRAMLADWCDDTHQLLPLLVDRVTRRAA